MKILKIDHLGIAVSSIDERKNFWTEVLGLSFAGSETVQEQKVTTAFFPVGESEVELLESTSPDGPIAKYLEKRGEGIQHVAFRVENIEAALEELKAKGIKLIDEKPRIGAGGAKIAFLHPRPPAAFLLSYARETTIKRENHQRSAPCRIIRRNKNGQTLPQNCLRANHRIPWTG